MVPRIFPVATCDRPGSAKRIASNAKRNCCFIGTSDARLADRDTIRVELANPCTPQSMLCQCVSTGQRGMKWVRSHNLLFGRCKLLAITVSGLPRSDGLTCQGRKKPHGVEWR